MSDNWLSRRSMPNWAVWVYGFVMLAVGCAYGVLRWSR